VPEYPPALLRGTSLLLSFFYGFILRCNTILGVESETIDYGLDLSPALQALMLQLLQVAKGIVSKWITTPSL
jgi:hypothetical protein